MKKRWLGLALALACGFAPAASWAEGSDVPGSKDPAIFNRMPGWYISKYEASDFGSYEFYDTTKQKVSVEGHKLILAYTWGGSGTKPSSLQVVRNYESAIKKIGGTVVYARGDDFTTLKLVKDGKETWVEIVSEVDAGWGGFEMTIVERAAMAQDVVATAASMGSDLKATGHSSLYGIVFEADKAELLPQAEAAIAEIARLLKQDPKLQLFVVGHTANVGSVEAGLKLSLARAEAVIKRLVDKYGIQATRLMPFGAGPFCPIGSNLTEEGKALNRRVELVLR